MTGRAGDAPAPMAALPALPTAIVVLAAGQGTRMRSDLPKVLHEIAGRPLVAHVVAACLPLAAEGAGLYVVVASGPTGERVAAAARPARPVVQRAPRGTGDALASALAALPAEGSVVVLNGDMPLVTTALVRELIAAHRATGAVASLVSAEVAHPDGLGRVLRDDAGRFLRVVEDADATDSERAVREVNAGLYAFDLRAVRAAIAGLTADNAQGELYLPDLFALLGASGRPVAVVRASDPEAVAGVNTQFELAAAARTLFLRRARVLGELGVALAAPERAFVEVDARVEAGARLGADVHLAGSSRVAGGARVEAARLRDVRVETGAYVGAGTWIDPGGHAAQGGPAPGAKGTRDRPGAGPG